MRAGQLRHRVTLQQLVAGSPQQQPSGEPNASWGDVATVYGAVEPLKGREFLAAQAVQGDVDTRITIRYRAGVTSAMRVSFCGKLYNIVAVIDVQERHAEMQLMCRQGASDG